MMIDRPTVWSRWSPTDVMAAGAAPGEAVDWIRDVSCEKAAETDEQRAFVVTSTRGPGSR